MSVKPEELQDLAGKPEEAGDLIFGRVKAAYEDKCSCEDQEVLPYMERGVFLQCIDRQWQDYLRAMDDLRQSVNLRAYGQRDPLIEYKREAFDMFERLLNSIKTQVANMEFRASTVQNVRRMIAQAEAAEARARAIHPDPSGGGMEPEPAPEAAEAPQKPASRAEAISDTFASMMAEGTGRPPSAMPRPAMPPPSMAGARRKVGRNEPCPCGSGKKYKNCCGRNEA